MCHIMFLWTLLFIVAHFTIFLKFRLSQHSTGNWKSVISSGMSDEGHNKVGRGVILPSSASETKRSDETQYG